MEIVIQEGSVDKVSLREKGPVVVDKGQVLVEVVKAAFTANVISYGLGGSALGYFRFFPTNSEQVSIPTWGLGRVIMTRHKDIRVGEKLYGFFPFGADFCTLSVSKSNAQCFIDLSDHRRDLSPVYNTYQRLDSGLDLYYKPEMEDLMLIFRPLFPTAWLLRDHCQEHFRKCGSHLHQVIVTSASSKTSYALAYLMKQSSSVKVIGLTSKANLTFVHHLNIFDQVILYDQILDNLDNEGGRCSVLVDMSGNGKVLHDVLTKVPDAESTLVGATHWEKGMKDLPGTFFFAPRQAAIVIKRMGGQEHFDAQLSKEWALFLQHVKLQNWCETKMYQGPQDVLQVYKKALSEGVSPREGIITRMSSNDVSSSRL